MNAVLRIADPLLDRVRALVTTDGHHATAVPGLTLYRFSSPTRFRKMPVNGVTVGLVLQGTKRIAVEGCSIDMRPGHMLLFTREAWQDAQIVDASADQPYYGLSLKFCPQRVARALMAIADAGSPSQGEAVPALQVERHPRVVDALVRLLDAMSDPVERTVLAPLLADETLFHLLRSDGAATLRAAIGGAEDADRILAAMAYMRENATESLSVGRIARHVAMSPSHFAHRFRAIARISPMRYVRQLRLEVARDLVVAGTLRMTEIADRTGYASAAHFSRDFARFYGQPPTRMREQLARSA